MTSVGRQHIRTLLQKEAFTLVVLDSGLGGMSIFAEIAAGFRRQPLSQRVSLIYYNAWPDPHRGYNRLEDAAAQVQVFDNALAGTMPYAPDMIFIACNTLSVLYPRTRFAVETTIPVVDIVDFGVDMMAEKLSGRPDRQAVILGTLTTIAERTHYQRLRRQDVPADRIVEQPCDQLATNIENGPHTDTVRRMIDRFMREASEKIDPDAEKLYAALCCTHFGYCGETIRQRLEMHSGKPVSVLNPNRKMAGLLFGSAGDSRLPAITVDFHVVSRIHWAAAKVAAIAGVVEDVSPEAAAALRVYEEIPDLFVFP